MNGISKIIMGYTVGPPKVDAAVFFDINGDSDPQAISRQEQENGTDGVSHIFTFDVSKIEGDEIDAHIRLKR